MSEGHIDPEPAQFVYGDGSGYLQQVIEMRRASWAIVTMHDADEDEACPQRARCLMRGVIDGWFPTVPRGELTALKQFLRHAGPGAKFVTDCKAVADGVKQGIPSTLTAAGHMHADLWRDVRAGVLDREEPPMVLKTKAHRSRAAACRDSEDHEGHWWGNRAADIHAKQLAHRLMLNPHLAPIWDEHRSMVAAVLKRAAFGVAWALKKWPALERRAEKHQPDEPEDGDPETGHVLRRRADGAVECSLCRLYVRSQDSKAIGKFRRQICGGSIFLKIDESHALRTSNGVTWCQQCGGFTSRWLRSLLDPCRGKPHTATRRNILRRLNAGLPPTAPEYLHQVVVSSGNPDGAPDHLSFTNWRKSGEGSPLDDRPREQAVGPRLAPPPKGIYKRLPANRNVTGDAIAAEEETRRQDEQRGTAADVNATPRVCSFDGSGGVGRRIKAGVPGLREPCNVCTTSAATVCRSCGAPLCISCARVKRMCRSSVAATVEAEPEADEGGVRPATSSLAAADCVSRAEASPPPSSPHLARTNGPGGLDELLADAPRRDGVARLLDVRGCHRAHGYHRHEGSDRDGRPRADPRHARGQGSRAREAVSCEAAAGDDSCHRANARRDLFLRSLASGGSRQAVAAPAPRGDPAQGGSVNRVASACPRDLQGRGTRARSHASLADTETSAPAASAPRWASLPPARPARARSVRGPSHQQCEGAIVGQSTASHALVPAAASGPGHHHLHHHGRSEAGRCSDHRNRQCYSDPPEHDGWQEEGPSKQAVVVAASSSSSVLPSLRVLSLSLSLLEPLMPCRIRALPSTTKRATAKKLLLAVLVTS